MFPSWQIIPVSKPQTLMSPILKDPPLLLLPQATMLLVTPLYSQMTKGVVCTPRISTSSPPFWLSNPFESESHLRAPLKRPLSRLPVTFLPPGPMVIFQSSCYSNVILYVSSTQRSWWTLLPGFLLGSRIWLSLRSPSTSLATLLRILSSSQPVSNKVPGLVLNSFLALPVF